MARRPVDAETARLMAIVGSRIRAARKARGMTQVEAARRLGITAEYFGRIDRGRCLGSVETLTSIANLLDVSVDHLLGAEMPEPIIRPCAPACEPRGRQQQIAFIVSRARPNPDLRRLVIALLKRCESH